MAIDRAELARRGDRFATEPLPPTRVKGYDEPVQAFRLWPSDR